MTIIAERKLIRPFTPKWEKLANSVARDYVVINVCFDCGSPVVSGFCCTYCGSVNPSGDEKTRLEFWDKLRAQEKELKKAKSQ